MVLDQIEHVGLYAGLSSRFAKAFDFLRETDLKALNPGRHEIEGDSVFALVQRYETRDPDPARFERHRRYADVQCLAEGLEAIALGNPEALISRDRYDAAKDIEFLVGEGSAYTLRAGQFMLLFPHEAHQPCLHASESPASVLKVVVKVVV